MQSHVMRTNGCREGIQVVRRHLTSSTWRIGARLDREQGPRSFQDLWRSPTCAPIYFQECVPGWSPRKSDERSVTFGRSRSRIDMGGRA